MFVQRKWSASLQFRTYFDRTSISAGLQSRKWCSVFSSTCCQAYLGHSMMLVLQTVVPQGQQSKLAAPRQGGCTDRAHSAQTCHQ